MDRRNLMTGGLALFALAGCSGRWKVDYAEGLDPEVTRTWNLANVVASVPASLTVSNSNTYAPNADIVWHGEPFGDRRAQVAAIMDEGITRGAAGLRGARPVTITARVIQFHAVTPAAVARAPAAVHNIEYAAQVLDAETGEALTTEQVISADLEAYVGAAAVAAAINEQTQKRRIIDHIDLVTRGWLGFGQDQRRSFSSIGR
ncbi:MAG: hypothetical protein HKN27_00265 [Silicimonas sp.]|nr:hypothetical protein [Silicimonas sp.]